MEHKLIQGGEQWLAFARSRIKALKAAGLKYASQQFEMPDGASVRVRIAGEQDYIDLSAAGDLIAVFANVQLPEGAVDSRGVPGTPGATLRIGSFPETLLDEAWYYPQRQGKTRFGTSPYSGNGLRLTQRVVEPSRTELSSRVIRWGVEADGTVHHTVFARGAPIEQIDLSSPYTEEPGPTTPDNYAVNGRSIEFIPVLNSSARAVLAMVNAEALATAVTERVVLPNPDASPSPEVHVTTTLGQEGASRVRLRVLSGQAYRSIDIGELSYSSAYRRESGPTDDSGEWVSTLPTSWGDKTVVDLTTVNDLERTFPHRRWHATERVTLGPDGSAYVLQETNQTVYHLSLITNSSAAGTVQTSSATRGLTLSHASPDGVVTDHFYSRSLGAHGYIENAIPSADGKKVYVYYGLHDAGEVMPDPADAYSFMPTQFTEYLDVLSVEARDGGSTFTFAKTIDLGAVTLRALPVTGLPKNQTDHYASKLHGAALEVGGFIWADRYCYDIAKGVFMPIPDYVQYLVRPFIGVEVKSRDCTTGPEDNRSSYLGMAANGRSATYYLLQFGLILRYSLVNDQETGDLVVREDKRHYVPGGYSDYENLAAESIRFKKPRLTTTTRSTP